MLIDRIWWGRTGKYLALGYEAKFAGRDLEPSIFFFSSRPTTQSLNTQYFSFFTWHVYHS